MAKKTDIPQFGPLSGVKVINAGVSVAGPFASQLMAEWGADVIWIENPGNADMIRVTLMGEQERRNQRNLALAIPTPEGREVLFKLIKDADIYIETSKGGQYAKWGLTDEVLWEHNPALVIVHVSGFGQYGAADYVRRPSYDSIAQAFSCYMNLNGYPDRPPVPASPYPGDYIPALFALGASLAALHKAKQTGKGESIDLAQYETLVKLQGPYPLDYLNCGKKQEASLRPGDKHPAFAGWGSYACKDGNRVYICFMGAPIVKAGVTFLGLEYGSEEYPQGAFNVPMGTPAGDKITQKLTEYLLTKTAAEAEQELIAAGIPVTIIMDYEMAISHPHYQKREVFHEWNTVDGKKIKGINIFPKFKNSPGQVWRGMPKTGMDNEDILTEIGLSEVEIEELYTKGVIAKK